MKHLLSMISLLLLGNMLMAQYVYTINADSVKITNHCDTAELILENHTQNIPGFLFNKGRGRTEFRRALTKLGDTAFLVGGDTLHTDAFTFWAKNGNDIYNINPGYVGIHRQSPRVMLDLPGSVNIDDTSSLRINYHPVFRVGTRLNYCDIDNEPNCSTPGVQSYSSLYVGDSAGTNDGTLWLGSAGNTFVGDASGYNNNGAFCTALGMATGHDNYGSYETFIGFRSGENCTPDPGQDFLGGNSYLGAYSGANSTGDWNEFVGYFAGSEATGSYNIYIGGSCGNFSGGSDNQFIGSYCGENNSGNRNVFIGTEAGKFNAGNENICIGASSGFRTTGSNNITLIGSNTSAAGVANATAIGSGASVAVSNTMVFGDPYVNTWIFNTNASVPSGAALVVGSGASNGNGAYLTTGGVWTNASDRNKKEHFKTVNTFDMLEKIAALPITRWNYKGLQEQHIGPVAQDFYRLFQVGADDKTISTIDPSGIALAGIQGLYYKWQEATQKVEEQQTKISALESQLQQQQAQISDQQAQLALLLEKIKILEVALDTKAKTAN